MKVARLRTGISKAFWCDSNGKYIGAKAPKIKFVDTIHERDPNDVHDSVCWLDELFEGGIVLPEYTDSRNRALTILLTGPPGTGKSSLALELCYRWAIKDDETQDSKGKKGLSSLYITSEASDQWAIQKANEMGWEQRNRTIFPDEGINPQNISLVSILEATSVKRYLECERDQSPATLSYILNSLSNILKLPDPSEIVKKYHNNLNECEIRRRIQLSDPDILVIDSLNIVDSYNRVDLFDKFTELITYGPKILITVLESTENQGAPEYWDYFSDIVIRLDRKRISDYMVRTIEIVKARYQSHVWGSHQLKFVQPSTHHGITEKRRAHPYRNEGGIFVCPSIHYYLSAYKRKTPKSISGRYQTSIKEIDELLKDGFPKGRCTGFVGMRGGHKSHLGYLTILHQVTRAKEKDDEPDQKGLIISLRDDEGMARHTMNGILSLELNIKRTVDNLEAGNQIEILYYPPGYVTPEEFFHRMFMSIQRLKYDDEGKVNDVTVLFNSLDQLSSRFPLCANEQIFIPGIIETLSAENISSIFIGVQEPGQPREQYGLLSMADALISFTRQRMTKNAYVEVIAKDKHLSEGEGRDAISNCPDNLNPIIMEVIRFSGGQAAGDRGILELVHKDDATYPLFDNTEGLNFIPFQRTSKCEET